MNIIIDAMGSDGGSKPVIEGSVRAVDELGISVTLVGPENELNNELKFIGYSGDKISVVNADYVIDGNEEPTQAIKKKDSSMRIALSLLKDGYGDAVISAGNTGALIAGATLILKRIDGVRRASLAPVMPAKDSFFLLIDAGANSECTPAFLKQFAIMGSIYMESIMGVKNPRVKLVNIGLEENKGPKLIMDTNKILKEIPIRYEGYIEAREVPLGGADVVVCDGFTGNVILKCMEGMGIAVTCMIKNIFLKNAITKLSALFVKSGFKKFKNSMDYTEYGGAPVLGVTKPVIKAHGSSNGNAIFHAILQAKRLTENKLVDTIAENIKQYGGESQKGNADE